MDPLYKRINRVFRSPLRLVSDDAKENVGMLRPLSESVWRAGEYLFPEDGYYNIFSVWSKGVKFDHVIFNQKGSTYRYVVEYVAKPEKNVENNIFNALDVRDQVKLEMKNYKEMAQFYVDMKENIEKMMCVLNI